MANKTCTKCGKPKPETKFAFRNKAKGIRSSSCKDCHTEYLREHYQHNKEMYIKNARKQNDKRIANNMTKLMEYLSKHPCVDCGEDDPIVLEFDHVRGNKSEPVSVMVHSKSWQKVQKEIKKCDVRCANCHKRKTTKKHHWRKAAYLAHGVIGNIPDSESGDL